MLLFLPGVGEIQRVQEQLTERVAEDVILCPLYGALPLSEQRKAILPAPAGKRKVVLATNIAETSLTIEGIRLVVDSAQERVARFDPRTGLTRLAASPMPKEWRGCWRRPSPIASPAAAVRRGATSWRTAWARCWTPTTRWAAMSG